MQDLIKQEQFELEVLDRLNSAKLLKDIVFGGGTMMRLCFGLNRFSVDLDFWIVKEIDAAKLFRDLKDCLSESYTIKDSSRKFYTLLLEFNSKDYPRALKIEIRKERRKIRTEQAIAYSKYSNKQVILRVVSLADMMKAKIEAFLNRKEIRDVFDIEFLLKKGITLNVSGKELAALVKGIDSLTKKDYTVKLGSLLGASEREYYNRENFKILKSAIRDSTSEID